MKKFLTLVSSVVAVMAFTTSFASAALTMPTVSYDDLYAAGTLAIGVAVVVMLVRRALNLFH